MSKFVKQILKYVSFVLIFVVVFGISAVLKVKSIFGDELFTTFTLQGAFAIETLSDNEFTKELMNIKYIKEDGSNRRKRNCYI